MTMFVVLRLVTISLYLKFYFDFIRRYQISFRLMTMLFLTIEIMKTYAFFSKAIAVKKLNIIIEIPNHERDVSNDYKTLFQQMWGCFTLIILINSNDTILGFIIRILSFTFSLQTLKYIGGGFEFIEKRYGLTIDIIFIVFMFLLSLIFFVYNFYLTYVFCKSILIYKLQYHLTLSKSLEYLDIYFPASSSS